jgi:hypothetical protein
MNNTELQKNELLQWLQAVQDAVILQKIAMLKNEQETQTPKKRQFGSGKGFFANIADDFNEPIDAFQDYIK